METLSGEMDRISQLPESIVHHILSFCTIVIGPPAKLVRMSVLSKTWFHLTASFPILGFDINAFRSRACFFKYLVYTTSRFFHQNATALRIRLIANIKGPAELDIVNRSLGLLLKNGVRELLIFVHKYRLPDMLLSVSVLESLEISYCELPSSLMLVPIEFKSLIKLKLCNLSIDDEVIKCLTTSCPLLEEFRISSCHGFKSFCVYGHQHLQKVCIFYDSPVERIDIEAPNLSTLSIIDSDRSGAPRMNLASCKKLTTVTYDGHPLPISNGFNDFLSNFPFVENLYLATEYECSNIKLSSQSLRTLVLSSNCELANVELSTPNLVVFGYTCNYDLFWDFRYVVKHANHLKACMHYYPYGYVDTLWFLKLRQFVDNKNGFKIFNLYMHYIHNQKLRELEKLKAIELPPYELEYVELQLETNDDSLTTHIAFVDAILWCCRPQSLTFTSSYSLTDFDEQSDLVKFTYEKLLQQEDRGHTNIQIVSPSSSKAQNYFRGLTCDGEAISFIKEEVV